jgi:hypothetical protein
MYIRTRILKADGSKLTSIDSVNPTNNFFRALFQSCAVSINSTIPSRSSTLFPYGGHILDTLTHGDSYKSGQLSAHAFVNDEKPEVLTAANPRFVERADISKLSTAFKIMGKLSESVFECPQVFPPDLNITITLRRSDSDKEVKASESFPYYVQFEEVIFYVRKYMVNPQVVSYHHKLLNTNGKYYYSLKTYELRSFNIPSGVNTHLSENLFRKFLPQYVIVTFFDSATFSGRMNKDCFIFKHFNIQNIKIFSDGVGSTLYRELEMDLEHKKYNTLASALADPELGVPVSRESYLEGAFFVVLDLVPTSVTNSLFSQRP